MRTQGRAVYVCFWYHRHLLLRATVRALPVALLLSRQAPCSSTLDPFRKDQEPQGPRPNSQRRPQPPLLGAAGTLDHNSPAAAGGVSSLRAATATSHSPRRSILRPGRGRPLNAHSLRGRGRGRRPELTDPIPHRLLTPRQAAAAAAVATAKPALAALAPPPGLAPPARPCPSPQGPAHWAFTPGGGARRTAAGRAAAGSRARRRLSAAPKPTGCPQHCRTC